MPNFNGAIIMHTMELLNSPATLREIVMTIAQNTELPPEDIKVPVKQTLEMGLRSGFLQKAEGRYYLESITFTRLKNDIRCLKMPEMNEKTQSTKGEKSVKTSSKTVLQKNSSSEAFKNPKLIPKKPVNNGTHRTSNTKPKRSLNEGTLKNPKPISKKRDGVFKNVNPLPKKLLHDSSSITSTNKSISYINKKSATSLAIQPESEPRDIFDCDPTKKYTKLSALFHQYSGNIK
nr:uncharacterized protein LOC108072529 [Drosophila kikkawai]